MIQIINAAKAFHYLSENKPVRTSGRLNSLKMIPSPSVLPTKTIGEIVKNDYRAAAIFRAYQIDYCCGGRVSLHDACSKRNVDEKQLLRKLDDLLQTPGTENHFSEWSMSFLVDYIIENHHRYVRKTLPEIRFLIEKVARVHGEHHPELQKMLAVFNRLEPDLLAHLEEEESETFPAIKALDANGTSTVKNPHLYDKLLSDHDAAGGAMAELEELSNGFVPPVDACTSYRTLFHYLADFQLDLHKHVHLENNILFPKAAAV